MATAILSDLRIKALLDQLREEVLRFDAEEARERNQPDPFASLLESAEFNQLNLRSWDEAEKLRQRQKNLMNKIGELHQRVIGRLDGWTSYEPGSGMPDVVGSRGRQRILVEVKNKHNTMNKAAREGTYQEMIGKLARAEFRGYIGIVVIINPRKRQSHSPFWKSFSTTNCPPRSDLIEMSGQAFYAIATDPAKRQPVDDFDAREDLRKWPSWSAFDEMTQQFISAVESAYEIEAPTWSRDLFRSAFDL